MRRFNLTVTLAVMGLTTIATPALAEDNYGCQALLCFAAANPRGISECVGTVNRVVRDLARGRGFPTCTFSSPSGSSLGSSNNNPSIPISAERRFITPSPYCPDRAVRAQGNRGSYYCRYIEMTYQDENGRPINRQIYY